MNEAHVGATGNRSMKLKLITRPAVFRMCLLGAVVGIGCFAMFNMPGSSYSGPLPALDKPGEALRDSLNSDVIKLAGEIGERNVFHEKQLRHTAVFIENSFRDAGYQVTIQEYDAGGWRCRNIEAEKAGSTRKDEIIVVGAHYDSVSGSPGANDNATGAAAVLALARAFAGKQTTRTVRFVEFVNEEPPFFQTERMGSVVYARHCRERGEKVVVMFSLETMGYYSDAPDSQSLPFPLGYFFPTTANFIGFVGNFASRKLVRQSVGLFRKNARFPSQGGVVPEFVQGSGFSDHWAFWKQGYPALMVTDTAYCRYSHYHRATDTPDKIQYDRLAMVVTGVGHAIEGLANP